MRTTLLIFLLIICTPDYAKPGGRFKSQEGIINVSSLNGESISFKITKDQSRAKLIIVFTYHGEKSICHEVAGWDESSEGLSANARVKYVSDGIVPDDHLTNHKQIVKGQYRQEIDIEPDIIRVDYSTIFYDAALLFKSLKSNGLLKNNAGTIDNFFHDYNTNVIKSVNGIYLSFVVDSLNTKSPILRELSMKNEL